MENYIKEGKYFDFERFEVEYFLSIFVRFTKIIKAHILRLLNVNIYT